MRRGARKKIERVEKAVKKAVRAESSECPKLTACPKLSAASFASRFVPAFFVPYLALSFLNPALLNQAVASTESSTLNAFGFESMTALAGNKIFFAGEVFSIEFECTGLTVALLFLALLFATRVSRKNALYAALLGVPFLLAFNLLRVALTLAGGTLLGSVETLHQALWFVDGGVVLLAWYASFKHGNEELEMR